MKSSGTDFIRRICWRSYSCLPELSQKLQQL